MRKKPSWETLKKKGTRDGFRLIVKMNYQPGIILAIICFSVISGIADAQGFIHASQGWLHGKPVALELFKSILGFLIGGLGYIATVYFLQKSGIFSVEIQTMIWFATAITVLAMISGKFFHWGHLEQVIAVLLVIGIGWLIVKTGG